MDDVKLLCVREAIAILSECGLAERKRYLQSPTGVINWTSLAGWQTASLFQCLNYKLDMGLCWIALSTPHLIIQIAYNSDERNSFTSIFAWSGCGYYGCDKIEEVGHARYAAGGERNQRPTIGGLLCLNRFSTPKNPPHFRAEHWSGFWGT